MYGRWSYATPAIIVIKFTQWGKLIQSERFCVRVASYLRLTHLNNIVSPGQGALPLFGLKGGWESLLFRYLQS